MPRGNFRFLKDRPRKLSGRSHIKEAIRHPMLVFAESRRSVISSGLPTRSRNDDEEKEKAFCSGTVALVFHRIVCSR